MNALEFHEYDLLSWLIYHIPRFSGERVRPEDFNPLRKKAKALTYAESVAWQKDVKDLLPDALTEAEVEKRWQEWKKRHGRE